MELSSILFPVLVLGSMGVLFGVVLGFASIIFKVEQDPKIPLVRECLPGANCGGCGYAGCDALAEAIAKGDAKVTACPVGGQSTAEKIAEVMGVEASATERTTAFVKCNGDCEKANSKYEYYGAKDCSFENTISGGHKSCSYGCLGDGSCVAVCEFDAIHIVNGVAVVDMEKCVSCGACINACPKNLIELVPYNKKIRVACNSLDQGAVAMKACKVSCIGCSKCANTCPSQAIDMISKTNLTPPAKLAKIDYEKCTQCEQCVSVCPKNAIVKL